MGREIGCEKFGGVPERSKGSDCKSDAKASVVRIHLPPPDLTCYLRFSFLNNARSNFRVGFAGIV